MYTSGTQNKDFDAVSQTDSTKSLVPSVLQATLLRLLLMTIALIGEWWWWWWWSQVSITRMRTKITIVMKTWRWRQRIKNMTMKIRKRRRRWRRERWQRIRWRSGGRWDWKCWRWWWWWRRRRRRWWWWWWWWWWWRRKLPWTILEEEFPVPKTTAASKIGNGVISLLWQLRCHCNSDHNKFSSYLIQRWWNFSQIFVYGT